MRTLLVAALLASCSNGSSNEPAPINAMASANAGVVFAITGKVTATRGTTARTLVKGDTVTNDDVIETAADASIAIDLVHNNARWSLGGGKKSRVDASLAWGLPKSDKPADVVADESSAAGRHNEKSATDTVASVDMKTSGDTKTADKPVEKPQDPGTTSGGKSGGKGAPGGATGGGAPGGGNAGDAFGSGGLGLSGVGEGGGGAGDGRGLGSIGTIGHGGGTGQGYGTGTGRIGGSHTTKAPQIRQGTTTVSGRLPPEVVQRIVRANFGQFRACYEMGLKKDPGLAGKIDVKFVIARDGTVSTASASGGLDDETRNCIAGKFKNLQFPEVEGGIVTVTYPITFAPGD